MTSVDPSLAPSRRAIFLRLFPSIMLPMFLAMVDQTIVATALPSIAASLGGVGRLSWVMVSYLLATTIAAPVYGRLGDALGRRRMLFGALAIFIAASLLCGAATSIEMLVAARVLQGLGGGGLMTLSQALVGEAVPPRERANYQGYIASVAVCSATFGPVVGGLLSEHFGWRSIFLVNLPVGLLAVALALRLPQRAGASGPFRFDFAGLAFFVLFVAPLLVALEQAQQFDAGSLPGIALAVTLSLVSLVLLLRQQRRATAPLLPLSLFRQAMIWRGNVLVMCHGGALVSLITFMPIYLRVVRGASAAETGMLLLPMTVGIGLGSIVVGRLVSRSGYTAIFPSVGLSIAAAIQVTLALFAGRLGTGALMALLMAGSMCMGTVMGVVHIVVQTAAGSRLLGAATGSVQFSRAVGAALGTAIVGTVLFATLAAADGASAAHFVDIVRYGPDVLSSLPEAARAVVRRDISGAFSAAFFTIGAFVCCGALLGWSMPVRRV